MVAIAVMAVVTRDCVLCCASSKRSHDGANEAERILLGAPFDPKIARCVDSGVNNLMRSSAVGASLIRSTVQIEVTVTYSYTVVQLYSI